ncbi:MAG: WYL domain-containing protein [Clostridia bacterium]|nr:WYL domain-containing protein [Clostridia bacterium]
MIFHEIHSVYYRTVGKLLRALLVGVSSEADLRRIIQENAFEESILTILPALKEGKWPLMRPDRTTPLRHPPTQPLTLLEKRWLKAILLDPRIQLFDLSVHGLEAVMPLFTTADYCIYDQYTDGDPYTDAGYQERFRRILSAVRAKQPLKLEVECRRGGTECLTVCPARLEYSEKDDKFRLRCGGARRKVINLARIVSCVPADPEGSFAAPLPLVKRSVSLKIRNERNTPERVLLHFAHLEKQAVREDDGRYLVHLRYDAEDETEMLIRILSFGPMVEVVAPERFRNLIIARLKAQKSCGPI